MKFDFDPLSCAFDVNKQHKTVFVTVPVMMNCKNEKLPLKPECNFLKFFFVEILNQICLSRTVERHRNENRLIKR